MNTATIVCINCGKEHFVQKKHLSSAKYCSITCQHEYQYKNRVAAWRSGKKVGTQVLKRFLSEQRKGCWECGITEWNGKSIVLELEHIDGNSANNTESNLSLLCPNCHSQTTTYKNRNRGNGRHYRRVRYSEGKSY